MANKQNAINRIKDIFSEEKIKEYKNHEWGPLATYANIYLNCFCNHFSDEKPDSLFLMFPSLNSVAEEFDFSYTEQAKLTAYVLGRNLTFLNDITQEKINKAIEDLKTYYGVSNSEEELLIKLQQSKNVIEHYVNEEGEFMPVNATDDDVEALKSTIFLFKENQITNLLFFCQKKYNKCQKSYKVKNPDLEKHDRDTILQTKNEYINLKKYLDNNGNVKCALSTEELNNLIKMLHALGYHEVTVAKIIKQAQQLNHDLITNEQNRKFEDAKLNVFTLEEKRLYIEANLILEDTNKVYATMQKQIRTHLNDINTFLNLYVDSNDSEKEEIEILIHVSFEELSLMIENVYLIQNSAKLSRKPQ